MKMNKLAAVVVMAMGMASFGASAAGMGGGTIHFDGEIIAAPCSIAPDQTGNGAAQNINLGQPTVDQLTGGGQSNPVPFQIDLQNCDTGTLKTVTTTFTGAESADVPGLLGVTGIATGAGIQITDGSSSPIALGVATPAQTLQDGTNTLGFSAYLVGGTAVTPGSFSGVTDFTLDYQ